DDVTLLPLPSRVIINAVPPTPQPVLDVYQVTGMSVGGEFGISLGPGVMAGPEGVYLLAGDGAFKLPVGTYDLLVNRGPEYEAVTKRVAISPQGTVRVDASLHRSVDTRGWVSADLHVHTGRGYDSVLPVEDRVVSLVCSGVELLVATDHNVLT